MATSYATVGTAASKVFVPQSAAQNLVITNTGQATVYLGQVGVTAATGFPLRPTQSINLPVVSKTIYAVADVETIKAPTNTINTGGVLQGATAIPVASGGTNFTQGMSVVIQDGASTEIVTVGAGSTGTSVVVSATAFAHLAGVTFGQLSAFNNSSVSVTSGT